MFAFSQVEPRDNGLLANPGVDIGRYLSTAADQGFNDSLFGTVSRMTEDQIYKEGAVLQPDELNRRYGLDGKLKFEEPEYERIAQLRMERKQAEMQRQYYLTEGNTGFFTGRNAAGMGVGVLTSILNPLDLGLAFLPITGSLSKAKALEQAGAGPLRQALARGLITEEALASRIPAPKFFSAMIDGTMSQAVAEIPLAIQNNRDQADYDAGDFLTNIVSGGVFAGALHIGVESLSRALRTLKSVTPGTREHMFRQALQQTLRDETIDVAKYVNLDEEKIRQDAQRLRNERYAQLSQSLDLGPVIHSTDPLADTASDGLSPGYVAPPISAPRKNEVFYHGRSGAAQFSEHQPMFFTRSADGAGWYAENRGDGSQQNITAAFLEISNPARIRDLEKAYKAAKAAGEVGLEMQHQVEIENMTDALYLPGVTKRLKELGHDGYVGYDTLLNNDLEVAVPFSHDQVKTPGVDQAASAHSLEIKSLGIPLEEQVKRLKDERIKEFLATEDPKFTELAKTAEIQRQIAEGRVLSDEQSRKWSLEDPEAAKSAFEEQVADLKHELKDELTEADNEALKKADEAILRPEAIQQMVECIVTKAL